MATSSSRARKNKSESKSNTFLEALKFVSVAQRSDGLPYQSHCKIEAGNVLAFDGGMAACHAIESDLSICPHTKTLITALQRCGESIAITVTDGGKLSIKSDKFKALIPCLPNVDLPLVEPDKPCANINDKIKDALLATSCLCLDDATEPLTAGVLLKSNSAVATNKHVLMEYWHGIDMPEILIPKASIVAICKTDKQLKLFGFTDRSATFYYDDGSFIKTSLFQLNKYPEFNRLFDVKSNEWPLPNEFFEAIEILLPFTETGKILFNKTYMTSHENENNGAKFDIVGIPDNKAFNGEYFKILKPYIKKIDFGNTATSNAIFSGENIRGVIAPMRYDND